MERLAGQAMPDQLPMKPKLLSQGIWVVILSVFSGLLILTVGVFVLLRVNSQRKVYELQEELRVLRSRQKEEISKIQRRLSQKEPLVLRVSNEDGPLAIYCPFRERCGENKIYRAYEFRDQRLTLYISFDSAIINHYSLSSFQNNFDYVNVFLKSPALSPISDGGEYHNQDPIRSIKFTSFENGVLSGTIEGFIDVIVFRDYFDECGIQDAPLPPGCYRTVEENRPLEINFELTVEQ